MSTYTQLRGTKILKVDTSLFSNFSNLQPGQLVLDTSNCSLNVVQCTTTPVWSNVSPLNVARCGLTGAGASNTAALAFGGRTIVDVCGNVSAVACTESYNGTSWTAGGSLGTARGYLAGAGTNTAALAFGGATGAVNACTESYNGSTWTAGGAMGTARNSLAGDGASNTAALAFGGFIQNAVSFTESYNVGKLYKKIKI